MPNFPHYKQLDAMDCGPTCLRIVAKYYGKSYSLQYLRSRSYITREGVSMLGIREAANTPTIYINGYNFPNQYEYSDMEYYIEDIKSLTRESKRQEACVNCK